MVDAKTRHVIDDHAAEIELPNGLENAIDVACKYRRMQSVAGCAGLAKGIVEVTASNQTCERRKNLLVLILPTVIYHQL